jgi:carbon monoxide dehydrogenase subunit G
VRIENAFEVSASPAEAWALLQDVPGVVPCLPGAELSEVVGPDAWRANLHVKLGPIALQFLADVTREHVDEARRRVQLAVRARETRGRGGATATIESTLAEIESGTRVTVVTDLALQGPVAQYGRGVVASVAADLTAEFARCLGRLLSDPGHAGPGPARDPRPVGGLRLLLRALRRALLRR